MPFLAAINIALLLLLIGCAGNTGGSRGVAGKQDRVEMKRVTKRAAANSRQEVSKLTRDINRNPNKVDAYYSRAQLLLEKGKYEKAAKDLSVVLKAKPDDIDLLMQRAEAYAGAGSLYRAIIDLTRVVELAPDHLAAYMKRGEIYAEEKRFERAVEDFSSVINLNPKASRAYSGRGNALYEKGWLQEAKSNYDRAIQLGHNLSADIYYFKATKFEAIQEPKETLSAYQSFVRYAAPGDSRLKEAREKISAYEKVLR